MQQIYFQAIAPTALFVAIRSKQVLNCPHMSNALTLKLIDPTRVVLLSSRDT